MGNDHRSRNGCLGCRTRHRKCDETRPVCIACRQRNSDCTYPVPLRWEMETISKIVQKAGKAARTKQRWNSKQRRKERGDEEDVALNDAAGHVGDIDGTDDDDYHDDNEDDGERDEGKEAGEEGDGEETFGSPLDEDDGEIWVLNSGNATKLELVGGLKTGSDRIAFVYYCNKLCNVLQAFSSTNDNPYRTIATLVPQWPVLLDTILACATQYMHLQGGIPFQVAMDRNRVALNSLRQHISSMDEPPPPQTPDTMPPAHHAALATILLQVAYSAFSDGPDVYSHLVVAHHMLSHFGLLHQPAVSPVQKFLVQRFAALDLATSLLHRRRPYVPRDSWLCHPDADTDEIEPSFWYMTGCKADVFAILLRVVHLAADCHDLGQDEGSQLLQEAYGMESEIHQITSRISPSRTPAETSPFSEDGDTCMEQTDSPDATNSDEISHLHTLSLCFAWMALLLVQRRLFKDYRTSLRARYTIATLFSLMRSIPVTSDVNSAMSLPFFVAAKEALKPDDREWVRQRHSSTMPMYPNPARAGMMELTEQIWTILDGVADGSRSEDWAAEEIACLERSSKFFVI